MHGDIRIALQEARKRADELGRYLDIDGLRKRLEELESITADPDLWNDPARAQKVMQESSVIKDRLARWESLMTRLEDAEVTMELAEEENDEESAAEVPAMLEEVAKALEDMELERMLSGEMDSANAIISINAGAGGVEAMDWAEMLQRMYLRWCQRKGYSTTILDLQPGSEAGIDSCSILVEGPNAYGYLKAETGVHRLVRISPFDSNARRHTSFASVTVTPDLDEDVDVDVREEDLRIDVYRASGAGGQHVNKTESAVRITHLPTGIVVQCQNERSQHQNKATAMRMLRSKLYELKLREKEEKMENIAGPKMKIDFGSQIRSYVLAPYRLITDHRTELKVGNVDAVLDGDLDPFIRAYLLKFSGQDGDDGSR